MKQRERERERREQKKMYCREGNPEEQERFG